MASTETQRISVAFSLLILVLAMLFAKETGQSRGHVFAFAPIPVLAMELAQIR